LPRAAAITGNRKFKIGRAVPNHPPNVVDFLSYRQGSGGPAPSEGLALIKAFIRIEDASMRQAITELVQRIADGHCKG
jgi:hypothetical protein